MKKEVSSLKANRLINHGPVVLVTCGSEKPNIITVAWCMPVGREGDFSLLAISLGNTRYSTGLILKEKEFVVNVPGFSLLSRVRFCGTVSGREVDKFKEASLTPEKAQKVKVPLIKECLAHLECEVVEHRVYGDHTVFIGKIVSASVEEEAFDGFWLIKEVEKRTIHHLGADFYCYPEKRVKPSTLQ